MSRLLRDLADFARSNNYPLIHAAELREDGEPEVIHMRPANACLNCYSIAKVFTLSAVGLLWDRGLLDLSERVADILPEVRSAADSRWSAATVDMALTHRLGLPKYFLDIDAGDPLTFGRDYLRHLLDCPLQCDPGTNRCYSDGAYYLLARIVEKRSGMGMDNFLWQELLAPLSFREAAWSHCPMGHTVGATGLYTRADDVVRLGALYLHQGRRQGRQLLSETWVRTVLERSYELAPMGDGSILGKGGMKGQMLLLLPERDRVVCGQSYHDRPQEPLVRFCASWR